MVGAGCAGGRSRDEGREKREGRRVANCSVSIGSDVLFSRRVPFDAESSGGESFLAREKDGVGVGVWVAESEGGGFRGPLEEVEEEGKESSERREDD